ncbi:MAG: Fic family protein [bacterium]
MEYKNRIADIDKAKETIDNYRPLCKDVLEQLKQYYRISSTYTSNALEGNTLTETETKIILEDGITIGGHPVREIQEAIGHSEAYDLLYKLSFNPEIEEKDILELHNFLYRQVNPDNAGKYRDKQVIITGTEFIPASAKEVPDLMKKFVADIPEMKANCHPVEFSALLHLNLVTIHPFSDGNGRTARLLMNLALLQAGYVVTIIPPIMRNDYIYALKRAQTEPKDSQIFINFISECVYESTKDYLRILERLIDN